MWLIVEFSLGRKVFKTPSLCGVDGWSSCTRHWSLHDDEDKLVLVLTGVLGRNNDTIIS